MKTFLISFVWYLFIQVYVQANGFGSTSKDSSFFKGHSEGWFWYKDPLSQDEETKEETINKKRQALPKKQTPEEVATKHIEAYRLEIEGKRNLALANPTYDNVASYMRIQQEMMQKARQFGQTWQSVVLNEPSLNFERVYPTAQFARHIQNDEQQRHKEFLIRNLSQMYGLFYFFKGGCPACEGFSPIVKLFAEKYSWDVMAISLDGSSHPLFDNVQNDNGMAEVLGIKAVPALIAYHPTSGNLIPISYAMTSLDRLEDNIVTLSRSARRGGQQ